MANLPGFVSDDDMAKMEASKPSGAAAKTPAFISDDDMTKLEGSQSPTLMDRAKSAGSAVLGAVGKVADTVDRYTGAPTRAAIGAYQNDQGLGGAAKAYAHQFGGDTAYAPSGKQIAQKAGFSDEPFMSKETADKYGMMGGPLGMIGSKILSNTSPSGAAGFAVDVAADPTNLIPVVGETKGLLKGTTAGAKALEVAGKGAEVAKSALGSAGAKVASSLSGVPEDVIKTYASKTGKIDDMIKTFGDDSAQAADAMRGKLQQQIQATRRGLNDQLSQGLKNYPNAQVDISPVLSKLEEMKSRANPNYGADSRSAIDDMITKIRSDVGENNVANITQLNDMKGFLQDRAKGAYQKGGQIFIPGKDEQQAAKAGAAIARKAFNEAAPELAKVNNQMAELHAIESKINKNLIAPEKPEAALLAAGAGNNPRNESMLNRIGAATGTNPMEGAQDIAAMKAFAKPALMTTDTTGKGLERSIKGPLLGAGVAHLLGLPVTAGAVVGAAATSPMVVKKAIQYGQKIGVPAGVIQKAASNGLLQGVSVGGRALNDIVDQLKGPPPQYKNGPPPR